MRVWGRRIPGWLVSALAAVMVLVFGVFLIMSGNAPGSRVVSPQKTSSDALVCAVKFSISPTTAAAGARITVQGSAWPAGKSLGVYLVDPSRKLRPTPLKLLTIPQDGAWRTSVTVPETIAFHAVGDETTGSGAPQTINQTVLPGQYLIYASAGNAPTFGSNSVCPVKFTVVPASGAVGVAVPPSGGVSARSPGDTMAAPGGATTTGPATARASWLGGGAFVALLLAICAMLATRRARLQMPLRMPALPRRRVFLTAISGTLALFMLVTLVPPLSGTGSSGRVSAAAATALYSDDFEADTLGTVPSGWSVEAGTTWATQVDGTQALEQTSASNGTLYGIAAGSLGWADYSVSASVKPGPGSTTANTSVVALDGRRQDVNNFYSLLVKNGNAWYLGKKVNGVWTTLAQGSISYDTVSWYSWTLTMSGTTISASINGVTLATATDSTFAAGNIGFKTRNQSGFDNVVVTAVTAGAPTPTPTATSTPTPAPGVTPTATATPIPAGTGIISGQVTDVATGAPIVGANVSTVPASVTATTDANGNYALQNLGPATYDVVMTASGYNENHVPNVSVTNGGSATASSALQGIPASTAMDVFTQPDQTGWNPSTDGHLFMDDASVYPGALVSVQGNIGFVDTYTAATDRDEWMSVSYSDQLVSADFNVSQFGQDAFQHGPRLLGRVQDGHHFIDFAINYATSTLQIWVNNGENWTMMKQVSVPAFKTGQWYHAKMLTVGSMSYGKVWAFNTAEPGWMISGSQTALTTGSGGARSTFADIYWAYFSVQAVTTITGVVTNTSGVAIAGATVSDGQNSVTTDAAGRYVLIEPNVSASYTVTASATGFTTQSASVATISLKSTSQNFIMQ